MLYLVIRLALALEHAERTRVPILLDDVMVNQDPERAQQIARVLRVVGQQYQVILMTCRPEMRDLMREVDPSTNVIELARFAGRAAPVGTARVEDAQARESSDDVVERVVAYLSGDWERRSAIMEGAGLSRRSGPTSAGSYPTTRESSTTAARSGGPRTAWRHTASLRLEALHHFHEE